MSCKPINLFDKSDPQPFGVVYWTEATTNQTKELKISKAFWTGDDPVPTKRQIYDYLISLGYTHVVNVGFYHIMY